MNRTKNNITSIVYITVIVLLLFATGGCPGSLIPIRGNGNITQQNFPLNDFKTVSVSGDWTVEITQNVTFSVTVDADRNLFDYLDIRVDGNHNLHIGFKKGYAISNAHCKASIKMPILERLTTSDSITGEINLFNNMSGKAMSIAISGSGNITANNIKVKNLALEISGSGDFKAIGEAQTFKVDISGSGEIRTTGLKTKEANISISGSGSAEIWVTDSLTADISGSGSVLYKGNPANVIPDISGTGSVAPLP
ncbi:head GIN domain-containing protein [Treponema sp. OMZ 906]|uniref:head GIN domain-containing protein n=1 Tax=Treponema sp. OMZ 906 TaxID=2563662 RepID=UPI0020A5661D|nr:head GIN domain-containing protein [Treponema sp. OMZ 906]UTC55035.1 DUF2807 domain-containing protein [Treponema sp. OMZ 906]